MSLRSAEGTKDEIPKRARGRHAAASVPASLGNSTLLQMLVVAVVHVVVVVHRHDWPVPLLTIILALVLDAMAAVGRLRVPIALGYTGVCIINLAEPSVGFWPAVLVTLLPLMFLARDLPSARVVFGYGIWTGALMTSTACAWLWKVMTVFYGYTVTVTLVVYLVLSVFMGLQFAACMTLTRILMVPRVPYALLFPLVYTFVEYWMPVPFPMQLALAYSWTPLMSQSVDLWGTTGLSLLTALVNGAMFACVDGVIRRRWKSAAVGALGTCVLILLQVGHGWFCLKTYAPSPSSPAVRVALVQPLSPLKMLNADHETKQTVAHELAAMSRDAVTSGLGVPDLLIWPEGAAPFSYLTPGFNPEFAESLKAFLAEHPVTMTFQDIEFVPGQERNTVQYYNHISLIGPDGSYLGGYRKNHPMPFTEYLPGERTFPWLRKLLPEARHVLKGEAQTTLPGPGGPFVPLICYEILDADFVRTFVNRGARYIINFTNDRFYGPVQQPVQHLSYAVFRAIENRRPLIRSTNSGISALIDARGIIAPDARTGVMEEAILRGTIHPRDGLTLYGRWGDWLPRWVLTPGFLAVVAWILVRDRKNGTIMPSAGELPAAGEKTGRARRLRGGKGRIRRGD